MIPKRKFAWRVRGTLPPVPDIFWSTLNFLSTLSWSKQTSKVPLELANNDQATTVFHLLNLSLPTAQRGARDDLRNVAKRVVAQLLAFFRRPALSCRGNTGPILRRNRKMCQAQFAHPRGVRSIPLYRLLDKISGNSASALGDHAGYQKKDVRSARELEGRVGGG